jgi:hypothetical protein
MNDDVIVALTKEGYSGINWQLTILPGRVNGEIVGVYVIAPQLCDGMLWQGNQYGDEGNKLAQERAKAYLASIVRTVICGPDPRPILVAIGVPI